MAYQDLSTYIETDPTSKLAVTETRCTMSALETNAVAYVYKDFGANHFDGNFEHLIEVNISGGNGYEHNGLWSLTQNIAVYTSCNNALSVRFAYAGANRYLHLAERNGGSQYLNSYQFLTLDTTYYLKIKRDEAVGTYGTLYCYIYSNSDRTALVTTLSIALHAKNDFQYLYCAQTYGSGSSYVSGYSQNFDLQENIPQEDVIVNDSISLSDEIDLNVSLEKIIKEDTITLSDVLRITTGQEEEIDDDSLDVSDDIDLKIILKKQETDSLSLSDDIELNVSREKVDESDSLSLTDAIELELQETNDLINDFRMVKQALININNKFSFVRQVLDNLTNVILTAKSTLLNINNKYNSIRQEFYNVKNDIRTVYEWQRAGDAGFQSLGKSYIKVYIDDVEQTDSDIDSISITKSLNTSHSATFELARKYDDTRPDLESEVEIKYHIWTLYKGYITQITPSDNPENIRINCQDEYWKQNKEKVYFNVGHRPTDYLEVYYNTIAEGLSACGVSFGVGNFIPQTIGLFGSPTSDAVTSLLTQAGNFAWYYKVDGTPKLWTSGSGDIVNITRQEIGKNLGLYQLLSHHIQEDVESIVNQYRVQMGNKVIRRFNTTGGTKTFTAYEYRSVQTYASANWNKTYEILAKDSPNGEGRDWHYSSNDKLYADVYRTYRLPNLDSELEEWTDRYEPEVHIKMPFGGLWKCSIPITTVHKFGYEEGQPLRDGFTIDYEQKTLVFNQPIFLYQTNANGEKISERAPEIKLWLWKKKYYSDTDGTSQNPKTDIANPLMFFTPKMGDYTETIQENLSLTNLSIQIGGWYRSGETTDGRAIYTLVPSWDDTAFALDYANWQLSQKCDVSQKGSIDITLDAFCYYGIELANRIMINNVLDEALNIESITLNISSFTASIQIKNGRYYNRSISIQSRGE